MRNGGYHAVRGRPSKAGDRLDVSFSFKEGFTVPAYSTANSAAAMFSLLMIGLHWQLVILAGGVCLLAAVAAASLFARMRETSGRARRCGSSLAPLSSSLRRRDRSGRGASLGLGPIAAGAVIGLGLGAGLYWLASAAGGVQEELRDAALSYMIQGLCMFDAPGRLVFWNKRFAEIIGSRAGCGSALPCATFCGSGSPWHLGRGCRRICPPRHDRGRGRQKSTHVFDCPTGAKTR